MPNKKIPLAIAKPITKPINGFFDFIREQGVVGLAIGFLLGGAVSDLVKSLVNNIINPFIGLIIPNTEKLAEAQIGTFTYGAFVTTLINFIVIAGVVYWIFKGLKIEQFDSKKGTTKITK